MEEIAFSDWPGQPVDLSGSNPWLPAYGFQPPHTLLDKDDFIGNPDADLFLQGSAGQHYMYLETIQEETSDDLQSESDRSESRASPVGWLATDSESGSVIRIDTLALDEIDSESEREIACPAKRRRQDNTINNLLACSDDESNYSLSRSSSLLQFETLERQCQDISSSSPSILSTFSFDSLEGHRKTDLSPDSLEREDVEPESDYYKTLKVDIVRPKRNQSRDSLLYNAQRLSDSESSESTDSERTLETNDKSTNSLKMSRSFDNLLHTGSSGFQKGARDKMSSENLSEDSGYSDHFCNFAKNKSSSIPNLYVVTNFEKKHTENQFLHEVKNSYAAFDACDVEYTFQNIASNFGSSYHDLRVLDKYDVSDEFRSPLIERFMRNGAAKWRTVPVSDFGIIQRTDAVVNIEKVQECDVRSSKYNATASASEPNLLQPNSGGTARGSADALINPLHLDDQQLYGKHQGYFENSVCVSSVPNDLNLAGDLKSPNKDNWNLEFFNNTSSIAAKNYDIADFAERDYLYGPLEEVINEDLIQSVISETVTVVTVNCGGRQEMKEMAEAGGTITKPAFTTFGKFDSCSVSSSDDTDASSFLREGSYLEAMGNRVDVSDDEYNSCYKENIRKSTIVEFDQKILKTISETSIQSFDNSNNKLDKLDLLFNSTPIGNSHGRNVVSTPNLSAIKDGNHIEIYEIEASTSTQNLPRKSSLINHSTSTSGISDEEKINSASTKSISGSSCSKGVHFCPVVAEVNWHDYNSETTTEKESSYSLSSTPEPDVILPKPKPPTPPLIRPKPRRMPSPTNTRISKSEPELQKHSQEQQQQFSSVESPTLKTDFNYEYIPLKPRTLSQPDDVGSFKRRGSKLIRKDSDGGILLSYVDGDGVKYKHSHLGDVYQSMPPTLTSGHVSDGSRSSKNNAPQPKLLEKDKHAKPRELQQAMEPAAVPTRRDPKKSGKLGGFFSRLASFRFSVRKSAEEKNKLKKKDSSNSKVSSLETVTPTAAHQRVATKEDYIYIPLKGPEKSQPQGRSNAVRQPPPQDNNNQQVSLTNKPRVEDAAAVFNETQPSACISAKPPLPKVPPRVVGASVKRRTGEAFAQAVRPEYRTIDSGDALPRPMEPMGLIETDLDTEVTVITSGAHVKTRSLMNLGAEAPPRSLAAPPHPTRPHKSMEFLLDKQNLKVVEPPENELQKGERVMSEHQLRIQRSLQKLTIPDWYKQYQAPREGFLLKNKSPGNRERWTGTSSKTPSLSSLGSNTTQSPIILSPTPHSQPFVRWSTSKLNSTASSPCASTRSSFNTRQPNGSISPSSVRSSFSYRQPYLGWRSQERLSRPRTPAERLASTLLQQSQNQQQQQQCATSQESPEIQTSIKEVTSAIVHYVSGLKPEFSVNVDGGSQTRSSSVSPRGSQKLCWLESSFVGTRPLDTPQTPVTLSESHTSTPPPSSNLRLELQKTHNGESVHA